MTITETSKGQTKTINVQRQPHDFIQMLNHLDPFVHEMPMWRGWQGKRIDNFLATLGQTEVLVNASSASQ